MAAQEVYLEIILLLCMTIKTMRRNKKDKELQKKIVNITGLGFNERQICVSKKECIKSTKLIYNEEEEVI